MNILNEKQPRHLVLLCVIFCCFGIAGCRARQPEEANQPAGPEAYGSLPGLKSTPKLNLRDELARIVEDNGTPEQLSRKTVADEDNAAVALAELFPAGQVKVLLDESAAIFPAREFTFDPIRLQKAINFRVKYEPQRQRARQAMERPKCEFGIRFTQGFYADLTFVDVARLCARLEAFNAAESLADGAAPRAIDSFEAMMRLAAVLAREKHPVPRMEAAYLRTEAFGALQAIARSEKIGRPDIERLSQIIESQLAAWPNDADAWIGDRALGLHAFEMIRDGQLARLATDKEVERFRKENILAEMGDAAKRAADQDEFYYLQAMRGIIECCNEPFPDRTAEFDAIDADLRKKQDTAEYPLVAARLLLPGIRKGHEVQARDLANWRAWAFALALSLGRDADSFQSNPFTGGEYRKAADNGIVIVEGIGSGGADDARIVVPAQ
jgi:hypothetical protein